MQFKRKLDPKKGRSQSSGEDVVWFSSIRAFFYLLSSPSPVLYICDALLLILFLICVVVVVVLFFFLSQVKVPPLTAGTTLEEE